MFDARRGALLFGMALVTALVACGEAPEGVTEPAVDETRSPCIICGDDTSSDASVDLDSMVTALDSVVILDTTTTRQEPDLGKQVHVRDYAGFHPVRTDDVWTPSECAAFPYELRVDDQDADEDGLKDVCELDLAWEFRPSLIFHTNETYATSSREPFFAVEPIEDRSPACWQEEEPGARVSIIYMLGYHLDYAPYDDLFPTLADRRFEHWGDSEFVIVDVSAADRSGTWKVDAVWLSQHGSTEVRAAETMTYHDGEYRARPNVWVAEGKHANYGDPVSCWTGGWVDRCSPAGHREGPWRTGSEIFPHHEFEDPWRWWVRNVGNSGKPLLWRSDAGYGRRFHKGSLCVDSGLVEVCRAFDQPEHFFLAEQPDLFDADALRFAGFTDADGVTGYTVYLADYEAYQEASFQENFLLRRVRSACG